MNKTPIIIRIDDRLIHGQVVVGWGSYYPIRHMIVGNDEISQNDWEKEMLMMTVPANIDVQVFSLKETVNYIHAHMNSPDLSIILINSARDIKVMADNGLTIKRINIGGLHFTEGKREYLPYLFLDDQDIELFRELIKQGFVFECQDVPGGPKYNLSKLLKESR